MNFNDYLQRAELFSLEDFIKNGCETYIKLPKETFSERLDAAMKNMEEFCNRKYSDIKEYDEVYGYFYEQASVFEEVYFEIGLIVGSKIAFQLCDKINELR